MIGERAAERISEHLVVCMLRKRLYYEYTGTIYLLIDIYGYIYGTIYLLIDIYGYIYGACRFSR